MTEALHLSDLDGAFFPLRDAVAEIMRGFGAAFTDCVYGDSRATSDQRDAIAMVSRDGLPFAVVVVAANCRTELVDTDDARPGTAALRRRLYDFDLYFARPYSGGDGEDAFLSAVELAENRWGSRQTVTATVDGIDLDFRCRPLGTEIEPNFATTGDGRNVLGHVCVKRLTLWEDRLCAG